MSGYGLPQFLLVPGNTEISQSMLVTSSPDDGLVIQSTHWSTLWVGHTYPSEFTQDDSPSLSIWITAFLVFIPIQVKASSTGIPIVVITDFDISGSQDTCILTVLPCIVGPPIKLTGGRIITGTGLYGPILSFLNNATDWWSAHFFTMSECAAKDTSIGLFSTSFYLHNSVALLYLNSTSYYHIIPSGRRHIKNLCCNNLARHMCTTWGTLASN